jgi:hypothetical protein
MQDSSDLIICVRTFMHTQEQAAHVPLCSVLLKKREREHTYIYTHISHNVKCFRYWELGYNFPEDKNGKQLNVK